MILKVSTACSRLRKRTSRWIERAAFRKTSPAVTVPTSLSTRPRTASGCVAAYIMPSIPPSDVPMMSTGRSQAGRVRQRVQHAQIGLVVVVGRVRQAVTVAPAGQVGTEHAVRRQRPRQEIEIAAVAVQGMQAQHHAFGIGPAHRDAAGGAADLAADAQLAGRVLGAPIGMIHGLPSKVGARHRWAGDAGLGLAARPEIGDAGGGFRHDLIGHGAMGDGLHQRGRRQRAGLPWTMSSTQLATRPSSSPLGQIWCSRPACSASCADRGLAVRNRYFASLGPSACTT